MPRYFKHSLWRTHKLCLVARISLQFFDKQSNLKIA